MRRARSVVWLGFAISAVEFISCHIQEPHIPTSISGAIKQYISLKKPSKTVICVFILFKVKHSHAFGDTMSI